MFFPVHVADLHATSNTKKDSLQELAFLQGVRVCIKQAGAKNSSVHAELPVSRSFFLPRNLNALVLSVKLFVPSTSPSLMLFLNWFFSWPILSVCLFVLLLCHYSIISKMQPIVAALPSCYSHSRLRRACILHQFRLTAWFSVFQVEMPLPSFQVSQSLMGNI